MALSNSILRELRTYFLSLDRKNVISGDMKPDTDDTLRLGAPNKKFHALYVNRLVVDAIEGVDVGGGGEATGGNADTVGEDQLTATNAPIIGNLYPLQDDGASNPVFPAAILPTDVAYENSTVTFDTINVTNYVDGIKVSAHDHSGNANMGVQVSHANLLNLSADHHTIYTRWDDTETVIKKWKFSNLAEENQSFNEYVGWEIEASVAMIDDGGWVPVMSTAQAVLQTLSFTDPTYGHSYPLKIISHAQYAAITLGGSAEIVLKTDSTDTWIDVGSITLSNSGGITVGSEFEVTQGGVMTATSGYIGAWQILDDKLQSTSGDVVLDSNGYILLKGSSVELRMSSIHADYRLWVGGSGESTWDETTAKFIVNTAGQVTAETVAIKGLLHNYGSDKWRITSDGHAEFESIKCRGRLDTLVFTKSTVSSISGVLALANGSILAQDMTDSQTYFYLDAPEFEFGDIVLLQPSADNMEWMLIISSYTLTVIQNADGEDIDVFKYIVSRDFDDFGTSFAFEKGVAINGRGSYSVGNDPLPLASGDVQGAFGDYQPSGTYTGAGGGWITLDGESTHITVNVRTGPLPSQYQQFVRIGNLQGMLNYTEIEWGFVIGDENNYMTYDQTDGLIIYSRDGATTINADGITSDSLLLTLEATEPTSVVLDTSVLYYYDDSIKILFDDGGTEREATIAERQPKKFGSSDAATSRWTLLCTVTFDSAWQNSVGDVVIYNRYLTKKLSWGFNSGATYDVVTHGGVESYILDTDSGGDSSYGICYTEKDTGSLYEFEIWIETGAYRDYFVHPNEMNYSTTSDFVTWDWNVTHSAAKPAVGASYDSVTDVPNTLTLDSELDMNGNIIDYASRIYIRQLLDDQGLVVYGSDDKSGNYLQARIKSTGAGEILANGDLSLQSSGGYAVLQSSTSYIHVHSNTHIYCDLGDDIGTNLFRVRNASSTDVAWINSIGKAKFAKLAFNVGGAVVDVIRDEDTMISNDAQGLATQQSIKAYVDTNVGSFICSRYGPAADATMGTTWTIVDVATGDRMDTGYYSEAGGEVTLKIHGDYEISFHVTAQEATDSRHTVRAKLQWKAAAGSYVDVAGSHVGSYMTSIGEPYNTATSVPIAYSTSAANDVIKIMAQGTDSTQKISQNKCRIYIKFLD